jgi:hypothetical protein
MKKLIISTFFLFQILLGFTQSNTGVIGIIVDSKTQTPIQSVILSIQNTLLTQLTDADGKFSFNAVPIGKQLVLVKSNQYTDQLLHIEIVENSTLDLGTIYLENDITQEKQAEIITLLENDLDEEAGGSENTSSLLQSTRDVFLQAAAFNFGSARFSVRGLDSKYANVMIQGISMNRVADGRPQYSNWGGLNDATRNQEFTNGFSPSDYVFGGVGGTQEINTRASIYRPGTRISFLSTNTNYSYRMMGTTASGMNRKGWAYVFSVGRRWAQNGYFEGTNYDANSTFVSVEKKINDRHSINFTAIYTQNKRGKNSPNSAEQSDLVGIKYNSYWGYQEGKIRNSRIKRIEEPLFILTHYFKVNPTTNWNTSLSYQSGQIGNTRIDYTKVNNPDPTYYQKLPSYFTNSFYNGIYLGDTPENRNNAEKSKQLFLDNRQLNWAEMYRINRENVANGSRFALFEDRNDEKSTNINTNISSQLSDTILLTAGVNYLSSKTKNFKNMLDLLGGDFFKDSNTFGIGDQQHSDLNNVNRTLGVGEYYGYNYQIDVCRLEAFTQFKMVYKKVDFYLAQTFTSFSYQREGLYRNGYYPTNSFGKSQKVNFDTFGFKGGFTYKITGRNFIDFNGIYMTKAPNSKEIFSNARVNNTVTDGVTNETIRAVDWSYILKSPSFKARFTGYFSEILDASEINFYYADVINDGKGIFVSEAITGMNKRNKGIETGLEYQLSSTFKITAVAAYGDYRIINNPNIQLSKDSSASIEDYGESKLTGLRQAGMPQQAYSIGVEYRDPKYWWIGANANYLSDNYLDVASILRTDNFYINKDNYNIPIDQSLADRYLKQEKFDSFYLVNLVGGKSWKIDKYYFGFFAIVNNVLNQTYKTGGFEQSRNATYRQVFEDNQSNGPSVFGPKYFYGYERTFMMNFYFSF